MIGIGEICSRVEQSNWRHGPAGASRLQIEPAPGGLRPDFGVHVDDALKRRASARIEAAVAFLLEHLDRPVRVAVLSGLAGVSPSYFFHLFKLATGSSPNDFFTRARMCRAAELLRETGLSVKEVSAALGYRDPLYFSRVFKSVHHQPPSRYRTAKGVSNGRNAKSSLIVSVPA